jgi:homoserine dehydrogenase
MAFRAPTATHRHISRVTTPPIRVAFLGFGVVGRALLTLLERRRIELERQHDVTWLATGVASRRVGWRADVNGLDPRRADGATHAGVHEWLAAARADVVFEAIPLDPHSGQPALDFLRAAIEHGAHAISANKGPLVHGYDELTALAEAHGVRYRFESAVMDGAPVFSLVRDCLPLAGLRSVRGVFTSTSTVVLESIERGESLADGIAHAQRLGIAEADPSYDVDGWDSAVKLCAIANVMLGGSLRPPDVERRGIRELSTAEVRDAAAHGAPIRLVGEVARDDAGGVMARVAPAPCSPTGLLGVPRGRSLVMHYDAEVFPGGLTVTSRDPDPVTTAYGMFADFVNAVKDSPARR